MTVQYLLNAVVADTVGAAIMGEGGSKIIQVSSTNYGGGAVTIEGRLDITMDWTVLTYGGNPAVFTADAILKLDFFAPGMYLRATLSGSTTPDAVSVLLQ